MDMVHFAKILSTTGESCGLDRDDYHREIEKRSSATKRPGESEAQSYARYIVEDPAGQLLFKAYRAAPMAKPEVQDPQELKYEPVGDASAELERLARNEAKAKNTTFARAYTAILTDPTHAELARRVKAEELSATTMVRDSRWPLNEAERTSLTRQWVGELDAVGRRRMRPNSQ
jgi:hypothetical protein